MPGFRQGGMDRYGVRGNPRVTRHRIWPATAVIAAMIALTGCAGGGGDAQSVAEPAAALDGRPAPESVSRGDGSGAADGAASARDGAGGEAEPGREQVKIAPEDRSLVYTARMTVRARDVPAAADQAKGIVTEAGGYVADERFDSSADGDSGATLTFKVPPDRYPAVIARLGRDLGKRERLHQSTEDVTEEVADVASRVKSAEAALAQLRTLLGRAEKIGEVLQIEREISARTAELESLQARQKALAARTGMATITLSLIGPAAAAPTEDDEPGGFLAGLATGWRSLVAAAKVGLTVLGVLLPWLVVLGVAALAGRLLWRRTRPARPAAPPPGPPPRDPEQAEPAPSGPGPREAP